MRSLVIASRDDGFQRCFIDRMGNGGGRNGLLAANVDAGVAAAVAELDRGFGAAAMDFADQPRQARNESVVIDTELAAAMAAGLFRRGHLDRDHARAAAHPCHVIGDGLVGDVTFFVRAARRHRRHDDPVRDLGRPDARGGEQDVQSTPASFAAVEVDGWRRASRSRARGVTRNVPPRSADILHLAVADEAHLFDEAARAPCLPLRRSRRPRRGCASIAARSRRRLGMHRS